MPLVLAPLLGACAWHPIDAANRYSADMQRQVAALGPACTIGNARRPDSAWATASVVYGLPASGGAPFVYPLTAPVSTRAVRVALDAAALHALEKIEVRDTDGNWAAIGFEQKAPPGCGTVWLEQAVGAGARQVAAVRLSFHPNLSVLAAANVGVLREAGGQHAG